MAKNWSAYEAALALYGDNTMDIIDIGSRYPVFTRTISMLNSEYVLDLLKAIPKVTARVVENGLRGMETEAEQTEDKAETKTEKKVTGTKKKETKEVVADEEEKEYEEMTTKELYKLCCDRGISSKCKSRSKDALIAVLRSADGDTVEDESETDDWGEEEENTDPYAGKSAKELFNMCKERGLKVKPKLTADVYAETLKKDDEKAQEEESEEEDDEWAI